MTDDPMMPIRRRGWSYFPCGQDKKPLTAHGFKDASTDPDVIAGWRSEFPGCLWGIPAALNQFFVVDLDNHPGEPSGLETWRNWVKENSDELPVYGPVQRTPSGGRHLLFKLPDNLQIPNNSRKLGQGVDLRSSGYICSGGPGYSWGNDGHGPEAELTEAPSWLIAKIQAMTAKKELPPIVAGGQTIPVVNVSTAGAYWLNKALQRAAAGSRNDTGFWLACQLRDSQVPESNAQALMREYVYSCPPKDHPYTENEAIASLSQAYNAPAREPAIIAAAPETYTKETPMIVPEPPEPDYPDNFYLMNDDEEEGIKRYTVRTAAFAFEERPPIEYLVENIVVKGGVYVFFGNPGAKKTSALLSLISSISSETPWCGMKTKKTKILWLDEELGEDFFSRKLAAALRGCFSDETAPIEFISLAGWQLDTDRDAEILRMQIEESKAGLVVIDVLANVMSGDENSVKDVRPVFLNIKRIAKKTGAAFIIIHHSNKVGNYRGSSFILGNVDAMIKVSSEQNSQFITFETEKVRYGTPQKWAARAIWEDDIFYLQSTNATPKNKDNYSKSEKYVIRYLTTGGASTVNEISESADTCSATAAKRAVYSLADRGIIERANPGAKQAIYQLTEKGSAIDIEEL